MKSCSFSTIQNIVSGSTEAAMDHGSHAWHERPIWFIKIAFVGEDDDAT